MAIAVSRRMRDISPSRKASAKHYPQGNPRTICQDFASHETVDAHTMRTRDAPMKTATRSPARKRAVNLTLNEDLVLTARQLTDNLAGVVESLLAEFVEREPQRRRDQSRQVEATVALWNAFEDKHGSFADEYCTL